jgi:aspartate/methionine/tyrosine aminotransferase
MPATAKRLNQFTESIIRDMTRVANKYGAINLAQGFPDWDPPKEVLDAAHQAIDAGHHQYAVTWGVPEMREALAIKQSHFMGLNLDPDKHIVVTCGSTEAMMAAMITACNPGDKVIVFSPYYENYGADTILCEATPIYVPLRPPEFNFDRKELRAAFEQGASALVLCNPANPSGKVFSKEELLYIAELAEEFDAFVITDEVYEHIVYQPNKHVYFAGLPGMFERTLSCSSLSKTYSMTGWRLGYIIASEEVTSRARQVHDFLTVGAAAPLQYAAATALSLPYSYYDDFLKVYSDKRDLILGHLDAAGLSYTVPQGAYYVLIDCSPFGVEDDVAFCHKVAEKVGVACVPGSSFFKESVNHLIRLHFARSDEVLAEAGQRLKGLAGLAE